MGRIGAFDGGAVNDLKYFKGQLDEFKMWNRDITEAEIAELYTPETISSVFNNEKINTSDLLIFPNPTTDFLQIKNKEGNAFNQYWVYNTQGQVMKSGSVEGQISTKSLSSGLYILKVESEEEIFVKYFIKK